MPHRKVKNGGPASPKTSSQGGYIALMATVIISMILLVMAVQEGSSGWYSRFAILGTEAKEQANSLAEGCADQALAAIVTNPNYGGDATTTTAGGTCHVFPIQFNTPVSGFVTVKTQAAVRGSYANLEITMNMAEIHLGTPQPGKGTLIVVTQTINDGSGTATSSSFSMHVAAVNPSQSNFAGSDTGVPITTDAGAYTVTETAIAGYATTVSTNCSGNISAGQIKFCTITNDDIMTTLTLVANVTNDNAGTNAPADFPLFIDGVAATLGTRYTVSGGTHTASATTLAGYDAYLWGYDCATGGAVTVATGQSKTCIIKFDDKAPPAPSCADTVMMLDRTGSMGGPGSSVGTDLYNEKAAANALVALYAGVLPPVPKPRLGVGVFGDGSDNNGIAPARIVGPLSIDYPSLTSAITTWLADSEGNTNISDAIAKASGELIAKHISNPPPPEVEKKKVIVLVSDGDATRPTGTTNSSVTLVPSAEAASTAWSANTGTKVAAVATDDDDTTHITIASAAQTYSFAGPAIPSGATNISVTLNSSARRTGSSGSLSLIAEDGSNSVSDGGHTLGSSYATASWAMGVNNPLGGGWSPALLNSGAVKFGVLNTSSAGSTIRATQLSATITYETPGTTPLKFSGTAGSSSSDRWSNATRALGSETPAQYATETSDGDRQRYSNFGFSGALAVPSNATITGIEVAVKAKSSDSSGCELDVDLAPDGSNFGSNKTIGLTGSDVITTLGGSGDTWSDSWTPAEVNSSNFSIRLEYVDPGSACSGGSTLSVDYLQAKIYYTTPGATVTYTPNALGNFSAWGATGGTAVTAVATQDNDTSYISNTPAALGAAETFVFPNAAIPAGATNIQVTLHAVAEETNGSSGNIRLIAEKGASQPTDGGHNLNSGYADYSWSMGTANPLGGSWNLTEVNGWTVRFGIKDNSTGGAVPRVTQLYLVVSYSISTTPSEAALNAADAAKKGSDGIAGTSDDTDIFTIFFGSGNPNLLANLASGSTPVASHQPGSSNDLSGTPSTVNLLLDSFGTGSTDSTFNEPPAWIETGSAEKRASGSNNDSPSADGGRFAVVQNSSSICQTVNAVGATALQMSYYWRGDSDANDNGDDGIVEYKLGGSCGDASGWTQLQNHDLQNDNSWSTQSAFALPSALNNSSFLIRFRANSETNEYFRVDGVKIFTLSSIPENGDSDNFFVSPNSKDMEDIFKAIGNQVCPAALNLASAPPPTTGTLFVMTQVINNNGGASTPANFTANVSATNPSQTSFGGVALGVAVTVDPGSYSVTENTVPAGYNAILGATCSSASAGAIVAGETRVCVLTNDDIPPPPPPPNFNINTGSWQEVPTAH